MKSTLIAALARGQTQTPALQSFHTYSFGNYYDPKRINFGSLRVFNEDILQPQGGFATHSHKNMEIVTIVLAGALRHQDSTGQEKILKAGDVQRMTAGTGIEHSEHNAQEDTLHFLQIWIHPEIRDLAPTYEQKSFDFTAVINCFLPLVLPTLGQEALFIHQNASIYLGSFQEGHLGFYSPTSKRRGVYLFVIEGSLLVEDKTLGKGDSVEITNAETLALQVLVNTKLLAIEVNLDTL